MIGSVISAFTSTKKKTEEVEEAVGQLSHRIGDLSGKMAALKTKGQFEEFLKSFGIAGLTNQIEGTSAAIAHYEKTLESLGDELEAMPEKHQKEIEALVASEADLVEIENKKEELSKKRDALDNKRIQQYKYLIANEKELIELQKKYKDVGLDAAEVDEKIQSLRIANIAYVAGIIPSLEKQNTLLNNKNEYTGEELEWENLKAEAISRSIDLKELDEDAIRNLIKANKELSDEQKKQDFWVKSINGAMLQGITNNARFAESFVNMIKKMAAEILAHMATFMFFKSFIDPTGAMTGLQYGIKMLTGIFHQGGQVQGYNTGGMVPLQGYSSGGNVDNVPAMLQEGEFVMRRSAVESIGIENLNRMNRTGQTSGGLTVNFSGNVMSDDFIESEAIPKIKDAIRRGADIGVS